MKTLKQYNINMIQGTIEIMIKILANELGTLCQVQDSNTWTYIFFLCLKDRSHMVIFN